MIYVTPALTGARFLCGSKYSLDEKYIIWGIGIFFKGFPDFSFFIMYNLFLELNHQIQDLVVFLVLLRAFLIIIIKNQ